MNYYLILIRLYSKWEHEKPENPRSQKEKPEKPENKLIYNFISLYINGNTKKS